MGSRLEFRVLGPLEVLLDDAPVRVGGPRQRALLALLLCNASRVVSRERLIDALLSDLPADGAEQTLRVQVSRLRKALAGGNGNGDSRLLASPPGYMLRVEPGELDLQAFEQHVANGRRALKQDDPQHAAMVMREAEAMWRGRPLADLEFEPFARLEVQRLEDLRLYAVEERIDAELALGEHAALCPELESLVAEHPPGAVALAADAGVVSVPSPGGRARGLHGGTLAAGRGAGARAGPAAAPAPAGDP
jgi:DNA-binding SARP family transcriptional activator